MPKKTAKKSRHEYRYADSLHRKIKARAKELDMTNSELMAKVFKTYFAVVPKPMPKPPKRPRR